MEDILEVPDYFVCPITMKVMEYPFFTVAGNCYEYYAIREWLSTHDTDPKTNQRLPRKDLTPNHGLRSQILAWFEKNPSLAILKSKDVKCPPPEALQLPVNGLDKVLRYQGKRLEKDDDKGKVEVLPSSFKAFGHTYRFCSEPREHGAPVVKIICDNGIAIEMPDRSVFATSKGLVFYDPKEIKEIRILPGTDLAEPCKFGNQCNHDDCEFAHPFVCKFGVSCNKVCKFLHPSQDTVKPVTPACQPCKYGTSCTREDCHYAHPNGRMSVKRVKARILVTHSHTLEMLATPLQLDLDYPEEATNFQIQGQFVFSFQPFIGSWAKRHFKVATVHRFDSRLGKFKTIGNYSLDGHYCNCAVAAGRYIVFSFWPYEEEAMRTIWECLKLTREMDKTLKAKTKECAELKEQLDAKTKYCDELERQLSNNESQIENLQFNLRHQFIQFRQVQVQFQEARRDATVARRGATVARRDAMLAKREAQESENKYLQMQQRQERARNERLRIRDPIHIYALQEGKSGNYREDWQLVVDYHKGAHDIELGEPRLDGTQSLSFIVDALVLQFDLVVPRDLRSLKIDLPLV